MTTLVVPLDIEESLDLLIGMPIVCFTVDILVTIRVTTSCRPGVSGEVVGTDTVSCGPRVMPS